MMEEPLAQFFVWWDGPDGKEQAVREQESTYRIAQRAFAAGYRARYEPELAPSRDVLPPAPVTNVSTKTIPGTRATNGREWATWKRASTFEPSAQPTFTPHEPDPFAKVRLSGPQQAALDRQYPLPEAELLFDALPTLDVRRARAEAGLEPGFDTMNLPVVGDAEEL